MPTPEQQSASTMRAMFSIVAPRYDFITRAFSYGMDKHWKRLGVQEAALPQAGVVMDLASGTGDFTRLVKQYRPRVRCVTVDITESMLRLARERGIDEVVCADATRLPFADDSFDCVFVGYGLRNFPDLKTALRELERVTKVGGLLVTLDFFLPSQPLLRKLYLAYLYAQGTFWGFVLHRRPRIYTYIPDSLRHFVSIPEFERMLEASGYRPAGGRKYIFGGIGLIWAEKRTAPQC